MNRPDLNILAKEVFEQNKAKGFHEEEHSNEGCLMMVIIELSKAVEADRRNSRNKRARIEIFNKRLENSRSYKGLIADISPERAYQVIYNETIKGSIEEELADAVLRLLDLAGLRGCYLSDNDCDAYQALKVTDNLNPNLSLTESIYYIICRFTDFVNLDDKITLLISSLEKISKILSIDLWQHVSLKMKYNQTREYKHNKLY